MDPEIFNSLADTNSLAPYSTSELDATPSSDLTLSGVDSSGNSTFPGAGSALGFAGSLLNAYGYEVAGQEQQQAYEYNAQLALDQDKIDAQQLNTEETSTLSSQRAVYAKAGVAMSGSALDTALNTASQFELDKNISNYNAQSKANMDRYEGQVAKQKADFSAGMSVLSGVAELAMAFL